MVADWSNHCPRTVGTLHHLRLRRTKGLDVPLWFSTLCHFTSLTAALSFLQGLLKVGLIPPSSSAPQTASCGLLASCAAAPSGASTSFQARQPFQRSLHPTKDVAGVQNGFISSRMRPRRPPVNPPNGATSLLHGGFSRSSATRCPLRTSWNWNRLQQPSLVGRQVAQGGSHFLIGGYRIEMTSPTASRYCTLNSTLLPRLGNRPAICFFRASKVTSDSTRNLRYKFYDAFRISFPKATVPVKMHLL